MAKRPEQRFASAAELRQELLAWAEGEPVLPLDQAEDSHFHQAVVELETAEGPPELTGDEIPEEPSPIRRRPRKRRSAPPRSPWETPPDSARINYALAFVAAGLALVVMALFGLALFWLMN